MARSSTRPLCNGEPGMLSKLAVNLAPNHPHGLRLANPVLVASGTFGYGTEYRELVDVDRLGAVISKGITVKPRLGIQHRG